MSRSAKRVLRWRRPAVQAELPLPEPGAPAAAQTVIELAWWQQPLVVATLAGVAALLLVITVVSQMGARRERAAAAALATELKTLTVRAPTRDRALRIVPNPRSWSASPDAQVD